MSDIGPTPPMDPNDQSPKPTNGEAPLPPKGRARSGPLAPPNGGSTAGKPAMEPVRPNAPVVIWAPSWPKWVRRVILIGLVAAPLLFLASWSYAEPSRNLCGGCHAAEAAAVASAESVHSDVPCFACHHRPGFLGAITYYPTLLRESIHEATGLPIANNVLQPRPCETCHEAVAESDGHRSLGGDCLACHGEVAHPGLQSVGSDDGHEPGYYLTHGRDAVDPLAGCNECHATTFCRACHIQATFPHPVDWIPQHGETTIESGSGSCESCHPTSYCGGCHGTDVPHPDNWLGLHHRTVVASPSACTTCHAPDECTTCHTRHGVHRQQSLFDLETIP